MPDYRFVLALPICAVAGVTDLLWGKVPNWLTGALALGAIGLSATHGLRAAAVSVTVMIVFLVLGMLAFAPGWIGGGDVKLAAAAAGALSYPDCVPFLLYTVLGGGALAIAFAIVRGRLKETLTGVGMLAAPLFGRGLTSVTPPRTSSMPYALAIALGILLVLLSQTIAPFLRLPL